MAGVVLVVSCALFALRQNRVVEVSFENRTPQVFDGFVAGLRNFVGEPTEEESQFCRMLDSAHGLAPGAAVRGSARLRGETTVYIVGVGIKHLVSPYYELELRGGQRARVWVDADGVKAHVWSWYWPFVKTKYQ